MYKQLHFILSFFLLTTVIGINANGHETIKIGVHYNPPLSSYDSTKQASGIFIDVLNDVAAINNWTIEYVPTSLKDGLDALQYGKIDLLSSVALTNERQNFYHFSEESVFTNWGVIYSNKNQNIESITDLEGKTLALENGDIHAKAILKLLEGFQIKANVIWCHNLKEVFEKIKSREADAGAVNKLFGYQQNLNQQLKSTPILFNPVNLHIAGGPLAKPLLNDFDSAIQQIKSENPNYYNTVINQWLIKDVSPKPSIAIYILIGLIFVLVIVSIIQREIVKKRTSKLNEAQKIGHQQAKALQQIEHEKTLILNSLEEQVVFMDNEYNLVWANDAFKKASHTPFEELVGTKCYKAYFNRDTPCDFCNFEKCTVTNRTEVREHVSEFSGKTFTHKTHPVFDAEHKAIGFVEILSDITEKKVYEDQLIAAKEKAEQSDYLKSAFLANMSHEIRTPMNAIIGFSELLEDDSLTKNEKSSYLKIIQSNGNQLLKLISDILIFSQIESGHVKLNYGAINVSEFLNDTYKQFESEIKNYDKNLSIKLISNIDSKLEIDSDIVRLKQVIFNLLTNAIKFTNKGGITLGAQLINQKQVQFYVQDTGIGIPENKHEEVFKRFSQIENNQVKKASGSGLGLTIAKDLIKQLGGKIKLESSAGEGSTFYVTHPISRYEIDKGAELIKSPILNAPKQ